jgi:hypothetical protein
MSDKRLLKRCGSGKRYLNEMNSASPRPSGLRIRRAEVWTKMNSGSICSGIVGIRKRSFQRFRSQGIRASETSVEDVLKLLNILRDFKWCLKDASSPNSASAGERTAGRFCCNRHYLKAMGCRKGSRTHEAAGQNNSSLTSLPALAGNDGWELF